MSITEEYPLSTLRHSTAHIMAHAVQDLWPDVRIAMGPAIEDGFYYDFEKNEPFTTEDLEKIEKRMKEIVKERKPFEYKVVTREEALQEFQGQPYKLEILKDIPEEDKVSFYSEGAFTDLCRGPHVPHAGYIKAFKLLSIAGAYFKGDSSRPMLQRIYGTAWRTKEELEQYLYRIEEAKKRDHRALGRQLGLFMFSQEVGPGLPIWLPKGATVRDILEQFMKSEQIRRGYQPVVSPHIANSKLYEKSGHLKTYDGKMFPFMVDSEGGETFILKPMNCPHHIQVYSSDLRSYRDLPIRLAEFGTVYRYEQSGELAGMLRVRGFTQDDSHIFCTPDQLQEEFKNVVDLILFTLEKLGLTDYRMRVGLRDPADDKYVGSDENWDKAETAIKQALAEMGRDYDISDGDAAFYGPKLDLMVRDALGREWQMGTVQVDYNLPERFELEYIGEDGQPHRPIMIHRAPFGSLERMIGLLIEHYAGAFPLWLAPVQAVIMPIADRHGEYGKNVYQRLCDAGFRVELDTRNEKTGYKIREAQMQKIPYMLIVGDREAESDAVSVRSREGGDLGAESVTDFINRLKTEVQ